MDEPTSSLQRDDVAHLFTLVRRLKAEGLGIVYISHFLEEVREIADVFTVLRDGSSVAQRPDCIGDQRELIAHMVGRSVDQLFPSRGQPPREAWRSRSGSGRAAGRAAQPRSRCAAGRSSASPA